jgi:hypothetical protein
MAKREWFLLVYRIPSQPTRLRAQIWRRLQKSGAIYLQNSVCILPATTELAENMQWLAGEIKEVGGEAWVFRGISLLPDQDDRVAGRFVAAGTRECDKALKGLGTLRRRLHSAHSLETLEQIEEEVRRIRMGFLRSQERFHFPTPGAEAVRALLQVLRDQLEQRFEKWTPKRRE